MRQRLAEYRVLRLDAVPVGGRTKVHDYIGTEDGAKAFFAKIPKGGTLYLVNGIMICGETARRGFLGEKRELHILHIGGALHEERMK